MQRFDAIDTIPIFDIDVDVENILSSDGPNWFDVYNKELDETFTIYPYISNGKFFTPTNLTQPNDDGFTGPRYDEQHRILEKIFKLKYEMYLGEQDLMHMSYLPAGYDYDYNPLRQVIITSENKIISETGCRKVYGKDFDPNVVKLNHRWYMAEEFRDEYVRNRKVMGFTHQTHVKQQWLVGLKMGAEVMYETRGKSNSFWKVNFKIDSKFFNEENGWFYTDEPKVIKDFDGWPLIWYDKTKHTKESALELLLKI